MSHARSHARGTCDGCPLCCCYHPDHGMRWRDAGGCSDCGSPGFPPRVRLVGEEGRRLASERDDLIAGGVDPADLAVPIHPDDVTTEEA